MTNERGLEQIAQCLDQGVVMPTVCELHRRDDANHGQVLGVSGGKASGLPHRVGSRSMIGVTSTPPYWASINFALCCRTELLCKESSHAILGCMNVAQLAHFTFKP